MEPPLRSGQRNYGDGLYEKAAGILGSEQSYLRKLKSLSAFFELCSRAHNLSWRHHYEVASVKKTEIVMSAQALMEERKRVTARDKKPEQSQCVENEGPQDEFTASSFRFSDL